MVELPWSTSSEDQLDVVNARRVLDEDHYDLQEVKDRIVEFLAVRKLFKERGIQREKSEDGKDGQGHGRHPLLRRPPGRRQDVAGPEHRPGPGPQVHTHEPRRHARRGGDPRAQTHVYRLHAGPGHAGHQARGNAQPRFMLDEIDKVGSDWRGDPSSALLEVLDPAQNGTFRDHYLNVDFDLSDVMFVTTANQLEPIPAPLRDRMEIIHLDGYTEYEKVKIAQEHLVKRQLAANGLRDGEIIFTEEALRKIVQDYTREAGVRNLERQIGAICRKTSQRSRAAQGSAGGDHAPTSCAICCARRSSSRRPPRSIEIPGIATGPAVTPVGGDILFIEATRMKGKGEFTLTGQLGDVMQESARIAHSYRAVKGRGARRGRGPVLPDRRARPRSRAGQHQRMAPRQESP